MCQCGMFSENVFQKWCAANVTLMIQKFKIIVETLKKLNPYGLMFKYVYMCKYESNTTFEKPCISF